MKPQSVAAEPVVLRKLRRRATFHQVDSTLKPSSHRVRAALDNNACRRVTADTQRQAPARRSASKHRRQNEQARQSLAQPSPTNARITVAPVSRATHSRGPTNNANRRIETRELNNPTHEKTVRLCRYTPDRPCFTKYRQARSPIEQPRGSVPRVIHHVGCATHGLRKARFSRRFQGKTCNRRDTLQQLSTTYPPR